MKKSIQLVIGVLVSGISLYLAFKGVNFGELIEILKGVSWAPMIPLTVLWIVHYVMRSIRWRYLLPTHEGEKVSIRALFDSILLGTLSSFILPFRLGEFIRPLILTRWTNYSFASAFTSVVLERFFDLAAVLLSFACIVPLVPDIPQEAKLIAYSFGILAVGLLGFMVGGCLMPVFVKKVVDIVTKPFPVSLRKFARKFCDDLLEGTAVVATVPRLMAIILLTVVVWATSYAQFYVMYAMFSEPYSVLLSVTTGVLVALFVAAPSTPGFVGVFQAGCVAAAALMQYPIPTAQAYSILVHVVVYLFIIVVGFALLMVHGLSLGELKKAAGPQAREPEEIAA
jgi:uncharacterized protein (TIRG00374 family)